MSSLQGDQTHAADFQSSEPRKVVAHMLGGEVDDSFARRSSDQLSRENLAIKLAGSIIGQVEAQSSRPGH